MYNYILYNGLFFFTNKMMFGFGNTRYAGLTKQARLLNTICTELDDNTTKIIKNSMINRATLIVKQIHS
jgi:hypothetical protein